MFNSFKEKRLLEKSMNAITKEINACQKVLGILTIMKEEMKESKPRGYIMLAENLIKLVIRQEFFIMIARDITIFEKCILTFKDETSKKTFCKVIILTIYEGCLKIDALLNSDFHILIQSILNFSKNKNEYTSQIKNINKEFHNFFNERKKLFQDVRHNLIGHRDIDMFKYFEYFNKIDIQKTLDDIHSYICIDMKLTEINIKIVKELTVYLKKIKQDLAKTSDG